MLQYLISNIPSNIKQIICLLNVSSHIILSPHQTISKTQSLMSENIQASKTFTVRGNNLQEALEEVAMALPMMLALTICPAMLGTQEAIRQSQSKTKREEHRARSLRRSRAHQRQ